MDTQRSRADLVQELKELLIAVPALGFNRSQQLKHLAATLSERSVLLGGTVSFRHHAKLEGSSSSSQSEAVF